MAAMVGGASRQSAPVQWCPSPHSRCRRRRPSASATPGNETTPQRITELTPELVVDAVSDPDNHPGTGVQYEFKIATGMDGRSGTVTSSGLVSAGPDGKVRWRVPAGTLKDGGTYAWIVQPTDGLTKNTWPAWSKKLTVDLRMGASGPSPFDTAGPVTVNLANGNAHLAFTSPLVSTLGGPMGVSFAYNSQEAVDAKRGLLATFYDGKTTLGGVPATPAEYTFAGKSMLQSRIDSSVSANWPDVPAPAVPADHFMAKWNGYVQVPAAGNWKFGVRADSGVRLTVGNAAALDRWATPPTSTVLQPTAMALTTAPVALNLEYYDSTGSSYVEVWADNVDDTAPAVIVPPDWFSTELRTLPAGWGASTPIAGGSSPWVRATVTQASVVLTDISGTAHTYLSNGSGGYTTPVGEYGITSLDAMGRVVYTGDDGTVTQFAADGTVEVATPAVDGMKPASPIAKRNADGYVTSIVDPVSKEGTTFHRKVDLLYGGFGTCPVLPGGDPAPGGMLCKIVYPDSGSNPDKVTNLYYDDGQLVLIEDPGGERTSFGYSAGVLSTIRDSVANDWLLAQQTPPGPLRLETEIAYLNRKVVSVILPAADGVSSDRAKRTYAYTQDAVTRAGSTALHVAGLSGSTAVEYDAAWRQTKTTTPLGAWSEYQWQATKDLQVGTLNSVGLKSTTVFDSTDRAVHSYGPAPAACFNGSTPVAAPLTQAGCGILPTHSSTAYDSSLTGLHAAYYDNLSLSGQPKRFSLGLEGVSNGSIDRSWGVASPATGLPVEKWSVRMTGLITFPTAGTYTLQLLNDDHARVYVGDVLNVNPTFAAAEHTTVGAPIAAAAGESRRIRVEYQDDTGSARLQLGWKKPGDSAFAPVPGSALRPDYGLVSTTTADDSLAGSPTIANAATPAVTTSFSYQHPWLGQATSSTVDPGGLALSTRVQFESPDGAGGWLRREKRTLPAGVAGAAGDQAATLSEYYGNLEAGPDVCGLGTGVKQFGMLKKISGPLPSTGARVATESVYDIMGRTVGTKVSGDTAWSCVTYDSRGRVTSATISGPSGVDTQTTKTRYTAGAQGIIVEVFSGTEPVAQDGSTLTTVTDLLGRSVITTDAWGTDTTTAYDPNSGRTASTTTTPPGGTASTTAFTYDLDGKMVTLSVDGEELASTSYDAQQLMQSIQYGDGTSKLTAITRDSAKRATGHQWDIANEVVTDTVVRSQSGRIAQHATTRGATTNTSAYSYDAAGRLVAASIPGHQLNYEYASTGGCGPNTAAGASGNRTGMTDVYTAPGATQPITGSTDYCYDWADRLTSSSYSNDAQPNVLPRNLTREAESFVTADSGGSGGSLSTWFEVPSGASPEHPMVLLALVASDGPVGAAQSTELYSSLMTASGGGLYWHLLTRENTQRGVSEAWVAYANESGHFRWSRLNPYRGTGIA